MGNQAPIYYWWVWAVVQLFGLNEPALRLTSVVAGTALVPAAFMLVRRWTGSGVAGLAVAVFVALDRTCFFYAQEARPYACVQLAGIAQIAMFWAVLERPTRLRRISLITLTSLLFYLHYTAILLVIPEAIFLVATDGRNRDSARYCLRCYLIDLMAVTVCLLPRMPALLDVASRKGNWAMFIRQDQPVSSLFTVFPAFVYLLVPVAFLFVDQIRMRVWRRGVEAQTISANSEESDHHKPTVADLRAVLFSLLWWFAPLAAAWLATRTGAALIFHVRYVIVAAAAPAAFAAMGIGRYRYRSTQLACLIAMMGLLIWQGGYAYQFQKDGRFVGSRVQDWQGVQAYLGEHALNSEAPVFVRSGFIEADALYSEKREQLWDYCLLPILGIYDSGVDHDRLVPLTTQTTSALIEAELALIAEEGDSWFVLGGTPDTVDAIQRGLLHRMGRAGLTGDVTARESFGNVSVLRIQVRSEPGG